MPIPYLRRLTSPQRSEQGTRHLARYLAFVAGAANAGGYLAVHQYTSHMSGVIAAMADNTALGYWWPVVVGLISVAAFLSGSVCTTLLVRWGRLHRLQSEYALPLLGEAILFGIFAGTAEVFHRQEVVGTIALLCFTMGLQNAMITKLSGHVIRTTHLTGMVTDIGIVFGRLMTAGLKDAPVNRSQEWLTLRLLASLVVLFFVGGLIGALGFQHIGFGFMVPLAMGLLLLAIVPVMDDVRAMRARV